MTIDIHLTLLQRLWHIVIVCYTLFVYNLKNNLCLKMAENEENTFKIPIATAKGNNTIIETEKSEPNINVATKIAKELTETQICSYKEPKWSEKPEPSLIYKFEVLKSGIIVEEIENLQEKRYWIFGRLPNCDIVMSHPTISRYHSILQYRPKPSSIPNDDEDEEKETRISSKFGQGWYIYDLDSTHGTFVNKMRIPPKTYIQVKVGHMIKFGASTRNYILQGPDFDQEPESELTVTELKELRLKQEEDKRKEQEMQEKQREKEGINWGMAEDADEETDLTINPYATTNNEELFLDDPKKTLRGFFEREGLDLEYKVDEMSAGTFVCRIELPIDDANGRPLIAEICHKGKKKDCVVQCALEACRILDRHGVLRQAHHEPLKRKAPMEDSDDDDDFLDRTGDIERKKLRKAAASQNSVLTYDDLLKQEKEISEKISTVEESISKYQEISRRSKECLETDSDDLDAFMTNLSKNRNFDKTEIRKLRVEQQRLKTEYEKLQRLLKIAKPVELPSISGSKSLEQIKKKTLLPLFGKRNKTKLLIPRTDTKNKTVEKEMRSDEEEMEEDEEIDDNKIEESKEKIMENTKSKEISLSYQYKHVSIAEERKEKAENSEREQTKRIFGPAFIPPEILQSGSQKDELLKKTTIIEEGQTDNDNSHDNEENNKEENATIMKKRRNRIRIRTKGRENVDMDDSNEIDDIEKYSGWVPPENQRGDGITSLNEKFGY